MARACEQCGGELELLKPGRVPKYCSTRCRMVAYRARQPRIPKEMREQPRWVRWAGDKRPIQIDGRPAKSTDSSTWSSYPRVRPYDRKGFVLGAGIGCIDLDHCLIDGVPTPAASEFLARLPKTYIEISPSGDGLHIWGYLPEARGSRRVIDGLHIETYSRDRYITITGRAFRGAVPHLATLPAE